MVRGAASTLAAILLLAPLLASSASAYPSLAPYAYIEVSPPAVATGVSEVYGVALVPGLGVAMAYYNGSAEEDYVALISSEGMVWRRSIGSVYDVWLFYDGDYRGTPAIVVAVYDGENAALLVLDTEGSSLAEVTVNEVFPDADLEFHDGVIVNYLPGRDIVIGYTEEPRPTVWAVNLSDPGRSWLWEADVRGYNAAISVCGDRILYHVVAEDRDAGGVYYMVEALDPSGTVEWRLKAYTGITGWPEVAARGCQGLAYWVDDDTLGWALYDAESNTTATGSAGVPGLYLAHSLLSGEPGRAALLAVTSDRVRLLIIGREGVEQSLDLPLAVDVDRASWSPSAKLLSLPVVASSTLVVVDVNEGPVAELPLGEGYAYAWGAGDRLYIAESLGDKAWLRVYEFNGSNTTLVAESRLFHGTIFERVIPASGPGAPVLVLALDYEYHGWDVVHKLYVMRLVEAPVRVAMEGPGVLVAYATIEKQGARNDTVEQARSMPGGIEARARIDYGVYHGYIIVYTRGWQGDWERSDLVGVAVPVYKASFTLNGQGWVRIGLRVTASVDVEPAVIVVAPSDFYWLKGPGSVEIVDNVMLEGSYNLTVEDGIVVVYTLHSGTDPTGAATIASTVRVEPILFSEEELGENTTTPPESTTTTTSGGYQETTTLQPSTTKSTPEAESATTTSGADSAAAPTPRPGKGSNGGSLALLAAPAVVAILILVLVMARR